MTPAQVEEAARRRYNAVNSNFWSQDEVFKVIYEGEQELALEALVIEGKDTSISTVAGTRTYSRPSGYIAIKRIEYNGQKLTPTEFRQDDSLTLSSSTTTAQGTPCYYLEWNGEIYLRPTPDAAQTVTIYGYKEATLLTTASTTLSVPTVCHTSLIWYTAAQMAAKDSNWQMFKFFMEKWESDKRRHITWARKKKRTDGFAVVKDEESLSVSILGVR